MSLVTTATSTPTETTQTSSSIQSPSESSGLLTSSTRPPSTLEQVACSHLIDTCSHCANSSRSGVSLTVTTSTTTFPGVAVGAGSCLCTESAADFVVEKDQERTSKKSQVGAMDAAYTMTNMNATPSSAPLLANPHHHSTQNHSTQIQYQSTPTNHSGPLLATPILSMIENHYITPTPSGTFVNPACLSSNNNDPQQLQHVMISGMVAAHSDKGTN